MIDSIAMQMPPVTSPELEDIFKKWGAALLASSNWMANTEDADPEDVQMLVRVIMDTAAAFFGPMEVDAYTHDDLATLFRTRLVAYRESYLSDRAAAENGVQ